MNISDNTWVSIKPSARRSIHSHRASVLSETMAKNERENRAGSSHTANQHNVRGTSSVDNVFSSTPVQPIIPPKHTNNSERNSFEMDERLIYTSRGEDDASYILSKSLPANLPSHSYHSDHSYERKIPEQDNVYMRSANITTTVTRNIHIVINKTIKTCGEINHSGSARMHNYPNSTGNEAQSSIGMTIAILVLLAGVLMMPFNMYYQINTPVKEIYDESRFYNDIDLLGNEYHIGGNAILLMQTGISRILKREDTGSFMFVYNNRDQNYNQEKFSNFMKNISETISKYLRNKGPLRYTMVDGSALKMRDHGELINRFQADLDRTGVMLVKDVVAIPSDLAMAFHYYCDLCNPLVKKSAIFFTLNLAECTLEADMKLTHAAVIERCLALKWSGVPSDRIGPLLTRVVGVVIDLTSAF